MLILVEYWQCIIFSPQVSNIKWGGPVRATVLHQHLMRRHSSSFHCYTQDFLLTNNTEMRRNNSHPVSPKLRQNSSNSAMNLNHEAQLLCPSAESLGQEAGRNDFESLQLTDNVNELCRFICSICHKTVGSLRSHIKCHKLKLDQYMILFPNIEYQRKTHHRYCTLLSVKVLLPIKLTPLLSYSEHILYFIDKPVTVLC